jgi:hypothetical protein
MNAPLAEAVRKVVTAGCDVKVSKRGRVLIQESLFPSGPLAEEDVNLVLASPAAEVRRVLPKRPRAPRRLRPNGERR